MPQPLPRTDDVSAHLVTLPMFPGLIEDQLDEMTLAVGVILSKAR